MEKTYYDFMNEISSQDLYERLISHGMFSEKLPPIFTGEEFLKYCQNKGFEFRKQEYEYVDYVSMRNINIPRNLAIPTPMGHELLAKSLSSNWTQIKEHFKQKTASYPRKVSRIHIRKMKETKALFNMSYNNWKVDGTPEPDIYIGQRYRIHADISKCYPSIYTHAIPWALVGKEEAKKNKGKNDKWYNDIDLCTRNCKNGETQGILIGPHTSNVLSEIVLCAIDNELLQKHPNYIRNIDDYICYTESEEEAEKFLLDLNEKLREYNLLLNHKKTEISDMPFSVTETWERKLKEQLAVLSNNKAYVDYKDIRRFIDFIVALSKEHDDNNAIILYAVKALSEFELTENAKIYLTKNMVSLSLLYPYLVPMLGEYVFSKYQTSAEDVERYANLIYDKYMDKNIYEACSYALLFCISFDRKMKNFDINKIQSSEDCVLMLMAYIYAKQHRLKTEVNLLKDYARLLISMNEMDKYWLFIYEALPKSDLKGNWVNMKNENVSFLKEKYKLITKKR